MLMGNNSEGILCAKKALEILENSGLKKETASCLFVLGSNVLMQGNYVDASDWIEKALVLYEELNDKLGVTKCYGNLGYMAIYQSDYPRALEYGLKALKGSEETGEKALITKYLNNVGEIYNELGNLDKALDYFQKSIKIAEQNGDKDGQLCMLNIADVYIQQSEYSKALVYLERGLKLAIEINNMSWASSYYVQYGIIYQKLNKLDLAFEYCQKAASISIELGENEYLGDAYLEMVSILIKQKKLTHAEHFARLNLLIADEFKQISKQSKIKLQLSEIYEAKGDLVNALKYYKSYKLLQDSVFNTEAKNRISFLEHQKEKQIAELERNKKEILYKAEIQQQRVVTYAFIVGFVLMLLIAVLSYRSYLSKRKTNKLLLEQKDVIEDKNEELTHLNYEILSQKNKILERNDELNTLNKAITAQKEEIESQRDQIYKKNKDLLDSIYYAQRIQRAMLPSTDILSANVPDHFILFKPRDIVSGDFYWFRQIKNTIFIVAADCTGHGVPGAFMSMLGISQLNEIVTEYEVNSPSEILNNLRNRIKNSLHQRGQKDQTQDGMDIAFIRIDVENKTLQYAGAHNPLYVIRKTAINYELIETKADRMPIGVHPKDHKSFTHNELKLQDNDAIYLFSDGYASQFGGKKSETFKSKRLQDTLIKIQENDMATQKQLLEQTLLNWQGSNEQIDDILIIGIKL